MLKKECVSRNMCAKDSVFCETDTCAKENMFHKRHTSLRKCFMTNTYNKENKILDTCVMRQGHTCQRQCFMRETCVVKLMFHERGVWQREYVPECV